jgi:hydrogenase maturation protein HypF
MIARGVNSPATTSLGRLFDAVSALVGVCAENTYEAQAAIELESYVDEKERAAYPVEVTRGNGRRILAVQNMIRSLAGDVARGASRGEIAAKFHNFVVNGLAALTCEAAVDSGIRVVALAGGVFQNDILLDRVLNALEERGLQVHFNRELPINDGSISFGQAVVADAILTQGGA